MEQAWSKHGAGMEQAWSRHGAGVEQAWSRHGADMEQAPTYLHMQSLELRRDLADAGLLLADAIDLRPFETAQRIDVRGTMG